MNKIDVYGSFVQALFFSGSVSIPKFLMTSYVSLGLTDQQMLLIIQILSEMDTNPYPQASFLAHRMQATAEEIEEMIGRMVERRLLTIEKNWNSVERKWYYSYSILGLIDKLTELWAIEGAKQFTAERSPAEKESRIEAERVNPQANHLSLENLVQTFEKELGRPLTGMECEHLETWLASHFSDELIIEALRRGVAAGIRSFRYLDSILREWEKKGLRTKVEVEADDVNFQARQEKKPQVRKRSGKPAGDKYENFYL
ncbi:MAG: DnaD domain-containing protein [Desulfitobacteriaceae bacterium]